MASTDRDEILLSPPPLNANHRSDESGGFYKSEKPPQISSPGNHPPTTPNPPGDHSKSDSSSQHRFLSPSEWARVAHGIGAIKDGETHTVVHPTCWYWPPKGLPDGLYRDVVTQRTKYFISYQLLSTLRWFLMIVQITIGAVLTALGSIKLYDTSTPITALAAANTIGAGILALLHNSGLPDRYRLDKAEFSKTEDFLKELLDTGIVEAHQTVDDVLNECFARFHHAKDTVLANKPEAYSSPSTAPGRDNAMIYPSPPVHVAPGHH